MFLIMSAAYITQELRSEFGALPPSFLPLGNRRLFQHQVCLAPKGTRVFLTLPESFQIPGFDLDWLKQHNVSVISLPDGLSLGASLVAALNLVEEGLETPLHVLFGDTLIEPLPTGNDLLAVANVEDNYDWAVVTDDENNWLVSSQDTLVHHQHEVVTGYFRFSNPRQLIRCITQCNWHFLAGLGRYRKTVGLSTAKVLNWLDFGHTNTYYHSKSTHTTQRVFNDLRITPEWVEKSGCYNKKIDAEANWFESLPPMIRRFTPQYLGRPKDNPSDNAYRLEYLHHTALNELFVFANVPPLLWRKIFKECLSFLKECASYKKPEAHIPSANLNALFSQKTKGRLESFSADRGIPTNVDFQYSNAGSGRTRSRSIDEMIKGSAEQISTHPATPTLIHGDFCFSNILYEFRANRIKVIDPRGLTAEGEKSIYGDIRYDLAKLSHSVLGMYDWIVAGYHRTNLKNRKIIIELPSPPKLHDTQQLFIEMVEEAFSISPAELYAMQVQLFLSMLPLHNDDPNRQDAFLANAFRLYDLMERHLT